MDKNEYKMDKICTKWARMNIKWAKMDIKCAKIDKWVNTYINGQNGYKMSEKKTKSAK